MNNHTKQNRINYVEFPAPSAEALSASKKFYGEVFGWVFQDWGDDYADTKDSGIDPGIVSDPVHRPEKPLVVLYSADSERPRNQSSRRAGRFRRTSYPFLAGAVSTISIRRATSLRCGPTNDPAATDRTPVAEPSSAALGVEVGQ